jgi:dimethylglycine dehydrogenase
MTEHTRVVIIGGGAVGVSCLYHLAKAGWKDCVLLEQNELTSGSTWHAAGNCPTFSTSWALLKLQKYSADLYRRLGDGVGYPINYHVVGAVRLAHTRERMDEFKHVRSMAQANAMEYEVLTPGEIRAKHPFVTLDDLAGALWDPYDGDIDPAQLTQALARGARGLGATIRRFTQVKALTQLLDGRWRVTTNNSEDTIADVVVNAAGYRAGEIIDRTHSPASDDVASIPRHRGRAGARSPGAAAPAPARSRCLVLSQAGKVRLHPWTV